MSEITDLDPVDGNNTSLSGEGTTGSQNMSKVDDLFQAILGLLARWTDAGTIASASICDIGAEPEAYLNVTGTTTITAFGTVRNGTIRFLKFAGALTLTHNATSLILPGGANVTTAAGDTAVFVSEGSGNWRCLTYQRADGTALSAATAATQSDQETATSTTTFVSPGRQQFHPSAAKVWLKCDASGNIEASYNIASIADTGTGLVDGSYTTAFSSANYAIMASNYDATNLFQLRITNVSGQAAGGFTLKTVNGSALTDPVSWFMVAYGDQ